MTIAVVFLALVFFYSLVSSRLERTIVTAPALFAASGIALAILQPDLLGHGVQLDSFLTLAEFGLVLLLFTDASRTELSLLVDIRSLPIRLLSTGMLLTIALGAVVAKLVFPQLSIWEAGILSAVLAPTDAGLGQVIVNSPRVPVRIRQALNVEAGLNDGLSVPFLMCFIALAAGSDQKAGELLWRYMVEQLGYGALIGIGVGVVGGWLLNKAHHKGWMAEPLLPLGLVALPLMCAMLSEHTGASMFIAAFVGGLAVQVGFKDAGRQSIEFTEGWGQLANLFVFFFFGLLAVRTWPFGWGAILYAVLSLTLIRMLPVAVAMAREHLGATTVLFMGWFGPRGLASIVLGLVFLEHEVQLPGEGTMQSAVVATVLLSIFAHGATALPGIGLYARTIGADKESEAASAQ